MAQWAAFWPLIIMAPKVGPMRGQPSSSATCRTLQGFQQLLPDTSLAAFKTARVVLPWSCS